MKQTKVDKIWLAVGREDAAKALSAIESELSSEDLNDYLSSFEAVGKPIKWDRKRKTFLFLDSKKGV